MKRLPLLIILFSAIFLIKCSCSNSESKGENSADSALRAEKVQHYRDSIAAAEKAEEERKAAIRKENIEKRLLDGGPLISSFAVALAKQVDELTNERVTYSIDTAQVQYNDNTGLVTIPFTVDWYGAVHYTFDNNPLVLHECTGNLLYYSDGTYKYKPLTMNEALQTDIAEAKSLNEGLEKLDAIFGTHDTNNSN